MASDELYGVHYSHFADRVRADGHSWRGNFAELHVLGSEIERGAQHRIEPRARAIPLRMPGELGKREIFKPFQLVGATDKTKQPIRSSIGLVLRLAYQKLLHLACLTRLGFLLLWFLGRLRFDVDCGKAGRFIRFQRQSPAIR